MSELFWLNDAQWARLQPLLPTDVRGVPRVDDRRVISGIIHVLRSGCRWVNAPPSYGPRKTLYNRFVRWTMRNIWQRIFEALAGDRSAFCSRADKPQTADQLRHSSRDCRHAPW